MLPAAFGFLEFLSFPFTPNKLLMKLLRVIFCLSLLTWLLPEAAAQSPRRLPNPIVRPKRNPNIVEPSQTPQVTESQMPVMLRQALPEGLVHVHQTVDLPQGEAGLMTLDGEPLPASKVNNVTLGMIVSADGIIVARLVGVLPSQPPHDLKVYTANQSRPLAAQFLGMDVVTELCVLKVESDKLEPVSAATLSVLPEVLRGKMWGFQARQGQSSSGNFSLIRPRISMSTVQAVKATTDFRYSANNPFYRLTPELTLVQDGSVVTTNDNKVFGVAIYDIANEISLVYPLARIQEIVTKITTSKESLAYGWLGATSLDIPATIKTPLSAPNPKAVRGVWVNGVVPDSPAEEAGIRVKDILLSLNERPVETRAQLASMLRQLPPDSQVVIRLKRDSEFKVVKARLVPLAAEPEQLISKLLQRLEAWKSQLKTLPNTDPQREKLEAKVINMDAIMKNILAAAAPPEVRLRVVYGLELQPMTPALLQHFGATHGLLVATVNENSPAARAGLQAGDVIASIGETSVTELAGLLQVLDQTAESGVKLTVLRRRATMTLAFNR